MTTILPLVAAVLALVSVLAPDPKEEKTDTKGSWPFLATLLVLAVLLAGVALWKSAYASPPWYATVGFFGGALGAWLASRFAGGWASAVALAATTTGFILWTPTDASIATQLGALVGAATAAWLAPTFSVGGGGTVYAICLAAAIAVDRLGSIVTPSENFRAVGTMLLTVTAIACLLPRFIKASSVAALGLGFIVLALGAFVIGQRYLDLRNIWILFGAGLLSGVIVYWFLPDDESASSLALLGVVIAIGLATLGFALERGFGMALTLLGAVSALSVLRHSKGLLVFAPLAGLVMYRVFRESHVSATRAPDIGQHYALIGLAVGLVLPLLALDWWRGRAGVTEPRNQVAGILWAAVLVLSPMAVAIVMGPKGVVGLVAGLGFAGVVELLRGGRSLQPMSLGLGISAATTLLFGWIGDKALLTREDKIGALVPLGVSLLVAVVLIAALSSRLKALQEVRS